MFIDDLSVCFHKLLAMAYINLLRCICRLKPTLIVLSGLFALHVEASDQHSLLVPEEFNILAVNGQPYPKVLLRKGIIHLPLKPLPDGLHLLTLQYEQVFDDGDDFDIIKSTPFVIEFAHLSGVSELMIDWKPIRRVKQAAQFARQPSFDVLVRTGDRQGQKLNLRFFYDQAESAQPQLSMTNTAATTELLAPYEEGKLSVEDAETAKTEPDALSQLKYWWQAASPASREAFKRYLETAPEMP
ncbi:MAG: DUF2057 family protein [Pseudomonadales bacterium]|nr:DUF2057 family protein [Pseudomonadales bacterium]